MQIQDRFPQFPQELHTEGDLYKASRLDSLPSEILLKAIEQ